MPDRPAYVQVAVFLRAGILTGKYPRGRYRGQHPRRPTAAAVSATWAPWRPSRRNGTAAPPPRPSPSPPLGVLWLAPES